MELMERLEDMSEGLETDDVGQKRYLMYRMMDQIMEQRFDEELGPEKRVEKLQSRDGYMYKLVQEFLTSSSTIEKRRKLEKMMEYIDR